MSESLFRQEVMDAEKNKMAGSVAVYCPPWRWLMISAVVLITFAVLMFLCFGSYTKRETAMGALQPRDGVVGVTPTVAGVITEVQVTEGAWVKANAPLITISSEVTTAMGQTRERVAEQLLLQRSKLEADLTGLTLLEQETVQGLQQRRQMLQQQLSFASAMRSSRLRQAELANRQLGKVQQMQERGYATRQQVSEQENLVLDAQARLQDVERQRIELRQQIEQTQQQLREAPLNSKNQRNDLERKRADIEQAMAENESRRRVILRAPRDSLVGPLLVKPGQVVSPGQSVLSLLPQHSPLQAVMMVSSRAIGFIQPGQRVVLRYTAYPYQKFGQQYGQVRDVSRTSLSPQEVALLTGKPNVQEQFFRVTVTLDNQQIMAYGKPEALRSGSALEADFLIDKRRLIEWVLEPLYALGRRAAS
ncbi:HlyD family efflux transporter periplasmic adaptor subunit [Serratia proteamaculans]|uniref:HlyD family secretion protein n=1 Tax=Serratia proteamaculans TaxID=28151 RepID=UPI001076453E|nr:HlyD family efflux transporter periplasmic adaptor subunit [Serratia proteamaculans]TFZ50992.1 HlyD family efflux transporter periplasmic adaptor subunit [Serratia proteamaculans]